MLIQDGVGVYHVMSRSACQAFLFGPREKEMFCKFLFEQAQFSGVEVLSYCIMSNHIHLLLRVPLLESLPDAELLRRYTDYYGLEKLPRSSYSVAELKDILASGGHAADRARGRILARMGNLPAFMRELKQRFSIWYNHQHSNQGTIWAARYKSLIVEDEPEALTRVAAYIDLNPVRAEIVQDPKDYRWCGYAAGLAGQPLARLGIQRLFAGKRAYTEAIRSYRLILFGKGFGVKGSSDGTGRGKMSAQQVEAVLQQNGKVPIEELLRVRVRYFSDGLALGSKNFIERLFVENRSSFGSRRQRGGTALPESSWGQLHIVRNLRRRIYG